MPRGNNIKNYVKGFFDVAELKSASAIAIVLLTVIVVLVSSYFIAAYRNKGTYSQSEPNFAYADNVKDGEKEENQKILVHIKGEVKNPGLYEVEDGCRVNDAIDLAGGTTERADINGINLAQKLKDEDEIFIPSFDDTKKEGTKKSSSKKAASPKPAPSTAPKAINLNTATFDELITLPGIGPAYANRILQYRREVGNFKSIEEIMRIKGISRNIYDRIKEYIKV
ncbi:MAG: helix-hairpin-helix domain-containing protein [Eubacteriales bacterium]|jgi:competence protein ComEA|nr:helix-hairpin-helix domain-containing protein [Eubacteriales bacterium]